MKYPRLLEKGNTIGICAPSSGVSGELLSKRLDNAILNIKGLGYNVIETASVRSNDKCVSADSATRAAEFMSLYENPNVAAIIPPWGGEFGMDMLPCLDFEKLASLPAKWVCGYSDTTTLMFPLTVISDIATIHGSNSMNMGYTRIHPTDLRAFDVMSHSETEQQSWNSWGDYANWDVSESSVDLTREAYTLDKPSVWKSLQSDSPVTFRGRMIGGGLDVMGILVGTAFAPVESFIDKYESDGFIWALESAEMSAANIYRALWQMRECGWFRYCNGIIFGRPDGYKDTQDFTLFDTLRQGMGGLNVPIIYDTDIGHIPPQMQIVNGAMGVVDFVDGKATVRQTLRI